MSGATILIVLSLICLGLLVLRRRRASQTTTAVMDDVDGFGTIDDFDSPQATPEGPGKDGRPTGVGESLMKLDRSESNGASAQRKPLARMPVAMPASLYGAYQVDLEIGKLVQGHPHKLDVVASRAPDDRRAIEASLLKTLTSAAADEDLQRRARGAGRVWFRRSPKCRPADGL